MSKKYNENPVHLDYEAELNPEQFDAATHMDGPILILAGAGSGKTRVITFRAAYMLEKGVPQSAILALTFTNKAAREMADRLKALTGKKLQNLTVSTFHSFGVKVLRKEITRLGWRDNFSIYDESDRTQLIRDCARETGFKLESFDVNKAGVAFSEVKTGRKKWDGNDEYEKVFEEYQAALKAYNAVDFDDLIGLPIRILELYPETREAYRDHYKYIMIDEFQDTSLQQYTLMRLLSRDNICVVGDDDQSIYSWRGANYENIINFEKDWPDRKEVTLYRNYRSTTTILDAANSVISNNTNRKEKNLKTPNEGGALIEIFAPETEVEEGEFIARAIKEIKLKDKLRYDQFGVLIRTNALTRHIEESFLEANLPYKVTGGTSFFQRKEIKDVISYLRCIANPEDDVNLIRIVNVPRRGLGRRSVEMISEVAKKRGCGLRAAMQAIRTDDTLDFPERSRQDMDSFLSLLEYFREELLGGKKNLAVKVRKLLETIDYSGYLVADNLHNEKAAKWKILNVESLVKGIDTWEKDPDNFDTGLFAWLNRISLITRDDQEEDEGGKVNLMTIHAAKGLEFEVVFIPGCEDGIIPHARSLEEGDGNVEEERRLFYVAITRARRRLLITACRRRRRNAMPVDCSPSPFLSEIPEELLAWREDEAPLTEDEEAAVWQDVHKMFM